MPSNTFNAKTTLTSGNAEYEVYNINALAERYDVARLPYSLKILLENLLRTEGNGSVEAKDIEALAGWDSTAKPKDEIAFTPARVVMQDFTGVPAVVDLAAMRDAMAQLGGDPEKINPLVPAELVIDHSVQVDAFATRNAFAINAEKEFERNQERYSFLRWGQQAFDNFAVVPPETGIVHQVNLEYLSRVVFVNETTGQAYPDTLVGTDSHTTMVNGLGILGWGVGGIEAEAAMLGQPISMLIPQVLGVELVGHLQEGRTATDLVLTITERLRERGVVGMFVEFFGEGLKELALADRATIGNMSPEFGSTCAIFPVDQETLRYLTFSGRPQELVELVETYAKTQGLWHDDTSAQAKYSDTLQIDLTQVEPSLAGPKRPQDRVPLGNAKERFQHDVKTYLSEKTQEKATVTLEDQTSFELQQGDVAIAAITSCTNTSNPSVMVGAGLLARNAVSRGLTRRPWVKTSLAPGSKVVSEYLKHADLLTPLEQLGFNLVGYGCTTCIGNSGPLLPEISQAIHENDLAVVSVLSGNRNFEGRINPDVKMNYLASPPLCVAYAIAGTMNIDLLADPLGQDQDGNDVYLRDIWPTNQEVAKTVEQAIQSDMFRSSYSDVFAGDERWTALPSPTGERFTWEEDSTYVRKAPYFETLTDTPAPVSDITNARVLALLGDSVTTDHISPAGAIKADSPAGRYLQEHGIRPKDFNSYGSRRGNHEVMIRGTFANIRLRNLLLPGSEGGVTRLFPSGEELSIYDAAMRYQQQQTPLIILAGKEYGSGSSRDWAAKGTSLLGVRAVLAQSFERIHRSNLVGMGVLPLQFMPGESAASLGLSGEETFTIEGFAQAINNLELPKTVQVQADQQNFQAQVRIDTPKEAAYFRHGGILPYVLRQLAKP